MNNKWALVYITDMNMICYYGIRGRDVLIQDSIWNLCSTECKSPSPYSSQFEMFTCAKSEFCQIFGV